MGVFDLLELTLSYVQYLVLILSVEPSPFPAYMTSPLVALNALNLDVSSSVDEMPDPLQSEFVQNIVPASIPLDMRFQFLLISIIAPLVFATIAVIVEAHKNFVAWFLALEIALLLIFTSSSVSTLSEPLVDKEKSRALLTSEVVVGSILLVAVILWGLYWLWHTGIRKRRKKDGGGYFLMLQAPISKFLSVPKIKEDEIAEIDWVGQVLRLIYFTVALLMGLASLNVVEVSAFPFFSNNIGTATSYFFAALLFLFAFATLVRGVASFFETGRSLVWDLSYKSMNFVLGALLLLITGLYVPVASNVIKILNCDSSSCPSGYRLPDPRYSLVSFSNLRRNTYATSSYFKDQNFTATPPGYCQPMDLVSAALATTTSCPADASLGAGEESSRVYTDRTLECTSELQRYFATAATFMIIIFMIGVAILQAILTRCATETIEHEYPLDAKQTIGLSEQQMFQEKLALSDNVAKTIYGPFTRNFRYWRMWALLHRFCVVWSATLAFNSPNFSRESWAMTISFIFHFLMTLSMIVFQPYRRRIEQYLAVATQVMLVVLCCLGLGSAVNENSTAPDGFNIFIIVLVLVVPLGALIVGYILTSIDEAEALGVRDARIRAAIEDACNNSNNNSTDGHDNSKFNNGGDDGEGDDDDDSDGVVKRDVSRTDFDACQMVRDDSSVGDLLASSVQRRGGGGRRRSSFSGRSGQERVILFQIAGVSKEADKEVDVGRSLARSVSKRLRRSSVAAAPAASSGSLVHYHHRHRGGGGEKAGEEHAESDVGNSSSSVFPPPLVKNPLAGMSGDGSKKSKQKMQLKAYESVDDVSDYEFSSSSSSSSASSSSDEGATTATALKGEEGSDEIQIGLRFGRKLRNSASVSNLAPGSTRQHRDVVNGKSTSSLVSDNGSPVVVVVDGAEFASSLNWDRKGYQQQQQQQQHQQQQKQQKQQKQQQQVSPAVLSESVAAEMSSSNSNHNKVKDPHRKQHRSSSSSRHRALSRPSVFWLPTASPIEGLSQQQPVDYSATGFEEGDGTGASGYTGGGGSRGGVHVETSSPIKLGETVVFTSQLLSATAARKRGVFSSSSSIVSAAGSNKRRRSTFAQNLHNLFEKLNDNNGDDGGGGEATLTPPSASASAAAPSIKKERTSSLSIDAVLRRLSLFAARQLHHHPLSDDNDDHHHRKPSAAPAAAAAASLSSGASSSSVVGADHREQHQQQHGGGGSRGPIMGGNSNLLLESPESKAGDADFFAHSRNSAENAEPSFVVGQDVSWSRTYNDDDNKDNFSNNASLLVKQPQIRKASSSVVTANQRRRRSFFDAATCDSESPLLLVPPERRAVWRRRADVAARLFKYGYAAAASSAAKTRNDHDGDSRNSSGAAESPSSEVPSSSPLVSAVTEDNPVFASSTTSSHTDDDAPAAATMPSVPQQQQQQQQPSQLSQKKKNKQRLRNLWFFAINQTIDDGVIANINEFFEFKTKLDMCQMDEQQFMRELVQSFGSGEELMGNNRDGDGKKNKFSSFWGGIARAESLTTTTTTTGSGRTGDDDNGGNAGSGGVDDEAAAAATAEMEKSIGMTWNELRRQLMGDLGFSSPNLLTKLAEDEHHQDDAAGSNSKAMDEKEEEHSEGGHNAHTFLAEDQLEHLSKAERKEVDRIASEILELMNEADEEVEQQQQQQRQQRQQQQPQKVPAIEAMGATSFSYDYGEQEQFSNKSKKEKAASSDHSHRDHEHAGAVSERIKLFSLDEIAVEKSFGGDASRSSGGAPPPPAVAPSSSSSGGENNDPFPSAKHDMSHSLEIPTQSLELPQPTAQETEVGGGGAPGKNDGYDHSGSNHHDPGIMLTAPTPAFAAVHNNNNNNNNNNSASSVGSSASRVADGISNKTTAAGAPKSEESSNSVVAKTEVSGEASSLRDADNLVRLPSRLLQLNSSSSPTVAANKPPNSSSSNNNATSRTVSHHPLRRLLHSREESSIIYSTTAEATAATTLNRVASMATRTKTKHLIHGWRKALVEIIAQQHKKVRTKHHHHHQQQQQQHVAAAGRKGSSLGAADPASAVTTDHTSSVAHGRRVGVDDHDAGPSFFRSGRSRNSSSGGASGVNPDASNCSSSNESGRLPSAVIGDASSFGFRGDEESGGGNADRPLALPAVLQAKLAAQERELSLVQKALSQPIVTPEDERRVKEQIAKLYEIHLKGVRESQEATDYRVNRDTSMTLQVFFSVLAFLCFFSVGICAVGMTLTQETERRTFLPPNGVPEATLRVQYAFLNKPLDSADLALAGYTSWANFTANCCCTAFDNQTASVTTAMTVEKWLCPGNVVKERLRRVRGGVSSLETVRPLCGKSFLNGCSINVGASAPYTVSLDGCSSAVSQAEKQLW